jgi:hypothetical protein
MSIAYIEYACFPPFRSLIDTIWTPLSMPRMPSPTSLAGRREKGCAPIPWPVDLRERWKERHRMTQPICERHDLLDALCLPFRHLQIRPLLENVTWPLERCFQQLAPQSSAVKLRRTFMGSPLDRLTPHETAEVCLLWTRPLRERLEDDCIRDLRYPDRKPYRCRNRPLLLEGWADAMLQYEMDCQAGEAVIQGLPLEMAYAASVMESTLEYFFRLRDQGKLSTDNSLRDRQRKKVLADVQDLAHLVRSLATEEFAQSHGSRSRGDSEARGKVNLFKHMHQACKAYGPASLPYVARDYAIAVIVQDFGIEDGAEEVSLIADRYRKRLQGSKT